MTYLVTLGLSANHGSELAVGWQWYMRLRARTDVTVLAHVRFDSTEFVPPDLRDNIVYLGERSTNPDGVNKHHVLYTYAFWLKVLSFLRRNATPSDRVLVVSPAAAWFLPFLVDIPVSRERVFYGPLGVEQVDLSLCGSTAVKARMRLRNLSLTCLARTWRALAMLLPRHLSFRFDPTWFVERVGPRFERVGCLPEVEAPTGERGASSVAASTGPEDRPVLVMCDLRARKNFWETLDTAIGIASARAVKIFVLGAPVKQQGHIVERCRAAGVPVDLTPRLPRDQFRRFLRAERFSLVTLSLSEGVPSLLVEALVDGAEVISHGVGGIRWLERFASGCALLSVGTRSVRAIRWDDKSELQYRRFVEEHYEALLARILDNGRASVRMRGDYR